MTDRVKNVGAIVDRHLNEIATHFVKGIKLTFVARLPGNDEADMVLTIDDPREAIKAIERRTGAKSNDLQQAINDAHNKVLAATRCHPNAVEWLVREALEILEPHADKPSHPQGEGEK